MRISKSVFVKIVVPLVVFAALPAFSQTVVYPPTIKVPVTFYDFHSDGSNPDFEHPGTDLKPDLVASTLDADRKPTVGTQCFFSNRVGKWFRPWKAGDFTIPTYSAAGGYLGDQTVATDQAYINQVFPDTLLFNLVGGSNGVYQLSSNKFFELDGKGFGAEGKTDNAGVPHNYSFTMEMHWQFTFQKGLTFDFEGDDDVWVFINGKRVIDLGGIHNPLNDNVNLDNLSGMTVGEKYWFDLFYAERHVTGSDIIITTNLLSVNPKYIELKPNYTVVEAGTFNPYTATVIDDTGGSRHEFDSKINWTLTPTTASSRLTGTTGGTNTFVAMQAYTFYIIGASYNNLQAFDTVYVKPGKDYRVWIEPDVNINTADNSPASLTRLQNPFPLDQIIMNEDQTQATAYAVVRDTAGNYTRLANKAVWKEVGPPPLGIAGVAPAGNSYTGLITRLTVGSTLIQAAEPLIIPDSVKVQIRTGYIKYIKLVNVVTGVDVTQIAMNTDDEITVKAVGKWSTDTLHWVDVTGTWVLNPMIPGEFPFPVGEAGDWHFSPTKPDTAILTVTAPKVAQIPAATTVVPVFIWPAPPSIAKFEIITPPEARIAGDTIISVVSIYNKDGLVPGLYCYPANAGVPAVYQDSLGKGVNKPDPTITTSGGPTVINPTPDTTTTTVQCFKGGLDTVKVVLYNAPFYDISDPNDKDSLHTLVVKLKELTANTGQFKLYPGSLNRIQLENATGKHLIGPDTLKYPDGQLVAFSIGYDRFENKRGKEISNWNTTGSLHPLSRVASTSQFYDASQVFLDEAGLIIAKAQRSFNGMIDSVTDSLPMVIFGQPSALDSAVTRDANGNGYLDRIDLYFTKNVTFPANFAAGNFTVTFGNVIFQVDSIGGVKPNGKTGKFFMAYLKEVKTDGPQTSWKPKISILNLPNAGKVDAYQTKDGAGPVIWKVVKMINNVEDRTQDVITVTFSEKIMGPNGNPYDASKVKPGDVLAVYRQTDSTQFDTLWTALDGITSSRFTDDTTLVFNMTNKKDITMNHYFNIKSQSGLIFDNRPLAGNPPVIDNRKAQVEVINDLPPKITVVPNPSQPTFVHAGEGYGPGNLYFRNESKARDWVKREAAGTVVTFQIPPPSPGETIEGHITIFDVVGNLVNQAETGNVLASLKFNIKDLKSAYPYDIYWNGSNSRGQKVAPGSYRTVVYLTYRSPSKTQKVRLWGTAGISY
jgi:fibro-slime domain-containing protein